MVRTVLDPQVRNNGLKPSKKSKKAAHATIEKMSYETPALPNEVYSKKKIFTKRIATGNPAWKCFASSSSPLTNYRLTSALEAHNLLVIDGVPRVENISAAVTIEKIRQSNKYNGLQRQCAC